MSRDPVEPVFQKYNLRESAIRIVAAALKAVDPGAAVRRYLRRDGPWLQVKDRTYDLDMYEHVFIIGGGKAGLPMARAATAALGNWVTGGLVNVKAGSTARPWRVTFGSRLETPTEAQSNFESETSMRIEIVQAGHPVPDVAGMEGTRRQLALVQDLTERDLVICLLSGGGSALLPLPAPDISLEDLQSLTDLLLRSGATINEVNAVRKHCSQIAGGQLARAVAPADLVTLILSDVVGSPLDVIASGPTVPDPTTFADAHAVLERYDILAKAPPSVLTHLERGMRGEIPDTPKTGDPVFEKVLNIVIGDNAVAAEAAVARARAEGLNSLLLSTFVEGEAREVARVVAALGKEIRRNRRPVAPPACLVLGGETTVTVRGQGKGGRNQELALAAGLALEGWNDVAVVGLATDGIDGPTDAAGAVADGTTVTRAREQELDPLAHLDNNDAYHFFAALG
ncbi:MAG TPA: glycerate kinase, partial [Anaerolineae bacterium]|nr:glycerate kinase [Anaerolineae bacterium]HIQ04586.1 glycerate kinase [Anaerolineae bacterium]